MEMSSMWLLDEWTEHHKNNGTLAIQQHLFIYIVCVVKITPLAWTFYVRLVCALLKHMHFILIPFSLNYIFGTLNTLFHSSGRLLFCYHSLTHSLCISLLNLPVVFHFVARRIHCGTHTHTSHPIAWPNDQRTKRTTLAELNVVGNCVDILDKTDFGKWTTGHCSKWAKNGMVLWRRFKKRMNYKSFS